MGIDRIGKGGAPPSPASGEPSGAQGAEKKTGAERPFHVERPTSKQAEAAKGAEGVDAAHAKEPLARLRAGEIDVDGYVDLKVDEATKGLSGLSPADLGEIKRVLREQMATDPGLSDLVHTATGQLPKPPED